MQRSLLMGLILLGCLAVHCGSDDENSTGGGAGTGTTGGTRGDSSSGSGGDPGTSNGSGGDAGSPGSGAVECPDDIEELASAVAEAICAKRAECCDNDLDDCMNEVTEAFEAGYPDLARAESEGSAALDCGAFDACAQAVAATSCDEWPYQASVGIPANEPECYDFLTPRLGDSDTCRFSYECQGGYCSVLEDESTGTCYPYAGENEACGEEGEPDQLCDSESMFCNSAGRCQRRLGLDATCTTNNECESLVCDSESGTCIAPGEAECEYSLATAPTNCSVSVPGRAPGSALVLLWLWGLGALHRTRRRHAPRPEL